MTTTIMGFTGTQKGMTDKQKYAFERQYRELHPLIFHHGDCLGADAEAHKIVRDIGNACCIVIHPPTNVTKRAYCVGDIHRACQEYLVRNREIVDDCNILIAVPSGYREQLRSGTWTTIRYARKVGKPIRIIFPEGMVLYDPPQ